MSFYKITAKSSHSVLTIHFMCSELSPFITSNGFSHLILDNYFLHKDFLARHLLIKHFCKRNDQTTKYEYGNYPWLIRLFFCNTIHHTRLGMRGLGFFLSVIRSFAEPCALQDHFSSVLKVFTCLCHNIPLKPSLSCKQPT